MTFLKSIAKKSSVKLTLVLVGDGFLFPVEKTHHVAGKKQQVRAPALWTVEQPFHGGMTCVNNHPLAGSVDRNWNLMALIVDIDLLGELMKLLARLTRIGGKYFDVIPELTQESMGQLTHSHARFLLDSRTPGP